ncbi:MAG TPA: thiamine pyrophosphate-dependent enzyme, partial [Polyangiaceae bacterium]
GVVGDGAFMMHGNEVSTAHAHGIGAIWVVLYDDDLHMVTQGQEQFFPDPKDPDVWAHLYRLGNPDIVAFARALGAEAYDVKSPREASDALRHAYEGAAKGRPQVVVARIDPKPVPPYYQKGPGSRQ